MYVINESFTEYAKMCYINNDVKQRDEFIVLKHCLYALIAPRRKYMYASECILHLGPNVRPCAAFIMQVV